MSDSANFQQRVSKRREHQRDTWGDEHDDQHEAPEWSALLARYVGRVAENYCGTFDLDAYEAALVDIAAIAQAAFESIERRRLSPPRPPWYESTAEQGGLQR